MTESEWLAAENLSHLVRFACGNAVVRYIQGWAGTYLFRRRQRKIRLYLCACCRHEISIRCTADSRLLGAVEVGERLADGAAERQDLKRARRIVQTVIDEDILDWHDPCTLAAYLALQWSVLEPRWVERFTYSVGGRETKFARTPIRILREIFGNPFRHVTLSSGVLTWNGSTVVKLAQAAYEDRRLPEGTLDNGRLAILADALEDAGCTNTDILGHLRSSGPHVRGCWAVDSLLGK